MCKLSAKLTEKKIVFTLKHYLWSLLLTKKNAQATTKLFRMNRRQKKNHENIGRENLKIRDKKKRK